MKPIKIISKETQTKEIDWSVPMWVVSEDGDIVLTSGEHNYSYFEGIVLPNEKYPLGRYRSWVKKEFKPMIGTLTIEISN